RRFAYRLGRVAQGHQNFTPLGLLYACGQVYSNVYFDPTRGFTPRPKRGAGEGEKNPVDVLARLQGGAGGRAILKRRAFSNLKRLSVTPIVRWASQARKECQLYARYHKQIERWR